MKTREERKAEKERKQQENQEKKERKERARREKNEPRICRDCQKVIPRPSRKEQWEMDFYGKNRKPRNSAIVCDDCLMPRLNYGGIELFNNFSY